MSLTSFVSVLFRGAEAAPPPEPPRLATSPGLYVAHHRWLDCEHGPGQLHKVGHTKDLGARLHDDAYVTCFAGEWEYAATLELRTKGEAQLLEAATLYCCRHRRLGPRELVRLDARAIADLAEATAKSLGLRYTRRDRPRYEAPKSVRANANAPANAVPASSLTAGQRVLVEALTVSAVPAAPADLVDDILSWDFTDLARRPEAADPMDLDPIPWGGNANANSVDRDDASQDSADDAMDLVLDEIEDPRYAMELDELRELRELRAPYDCVQVLPPLELRDYQHEAARRCLDELRARGCAILQMACRTGKTPVAYRIMHEYCGSPGEVRPRSCTSSRASRSCARRRRNWRTTGSPVRCSWWAPTCGRCRSRTAGSTR